MKSCMTIILLVLVAMLTGCLQEQEKTEPLRAGLMGTDPSPPSTTWTIKSLGTLLEVSGPTIPGFRYSVLHTENLTEPWEHVGSFQATGWKTSLLSLGKSRSGFVKFQTTGYDGQATSMYDGSNLGWLHPSILQKRIWVLAEAQAWQLGAVSPVPVLYPDERLDHEK